jgi:hypothetical protein
MVHPKWKANRSTLRFVEIDTKQLIRSCLPPTPRRRLRYRRCRSEFESAIGGFFVLPIVNRGQRSTTFGSDFHLQTSSWTTWPPMRQKFARRYALTFLSRSSPSLPLTTIQLHPAHEVSWMFQRADPEYIHAFVSFTPPLVNKMMKPACKTTIGETTNTVLLRVIL